MEWSKKTWKRITILEWWFFLWRALVQWLGKWKRKIDPFQWRCLRRPMEKWFCKWKRILYKIWWLKIHWRLDKRPLKRKWYWNMDRQFKIWRLIFFRKKKWLRNKFEKASLAFVDKDISLESKEFYIKKITSNISLLINQNKLW